MTSSMLGFGHTTEEGERLAVLHSEQLRRVSTVCEVAGVTETVAREALDANAWNLESAVMQCVMHIPLSPPAAPALAAAAVEATPPPLPRRASASAGDASVTFGDLFHEDESVCNPSETLSVQRTQSNGSGGSAHRHHPFTMLTPPDASLRGVHTAVPPPPCASIKSPPPSRLQPAQPTQPVLPLLPQAPPAFVCPIPPPTAPAASLKCGGVDVRMMREMFPLLQVDIVEEAVERYEGQETKTIEELLWRNQDEEDEYPGDAPEPVYLNVYNLAPERSLDKFGMGVFHSGIEVYGREWSFGGPSSPDVDADMSGVFWVNPQTAMPCLFKRIELGSTRLSHREVWRKVLNPAHEDWPVKDYHLIHRNCNHFSSFVTKKLGLKPLPSWVNRAARWGQAVVPSKVIRYLLKEADPAAAAPSSSSSSSRTPNTAREPKRTGSFFGSISTAKSVKLSRAKDDSELPE